MSKLAYEHMLSLVSPVIYMELKGLTIDQVLRNKKIKEFQEKLDKLESSLPFSPYSPKQVGEFLYGEMEIKPRINRKTKTITTNDEALQAIYKTKPLPEIKAILTCRHLKKMVSTYFEVPLHNGRMLPSINITGAETGRYSSNLHSFPNAEADIVIPDEEMILVEADLSQAEARVVAWLTGEGSFMHFFRIGKDIHSEVAKMIGVKRDVGKTLVHAGNYLIGASGFAAVAKCSVPEARKHLFAYHNRFPAIKRWHGRVIEQIKTTRTLTTALGRSRTFYGRFGDDLWREAIAYEPQSIVGDALNIGLRRLYDLNYDILFPKHDSVLLQVPKPLTQNIINSIKSALSIKLIINGRELIIPVDVSFGSNWKKSKLGGNMRPWKD